MEKAELENKTMVHVDMLELKQDTPLRSQNSRKT
jgi:hypothetical protein